MFRRDIIVMLVVALAMCGLLAHYAIKGEELPIWQALLVAAVNVIAAAKLFLTVKKAKEEQQREAARRAQQRHSA